jgi:histidine triad (HIT) family protein
MILEGFGVDHAHAKLFPMHGTMTAAWRPLSRPADKYVHQYEGYISSHGHRRADDQELAAGTEDLGVGAPSGCTRRSIG